MSMRLTRGLAGVARLRPTSVLLTRLAHPAASISARYQSSVPERPDPKTKAQSFLDSLPGNSLISKTAILSAASGVSIFAISNEYYVVNEETVVALCLLTVFAAIGKYAGPMYTEWATGQVNKIKDILNSARADHTQAVKDRIDNVSQMATVVDVTKGLFEVSKETAHLESNAFELEQRTAFVAEAKSVLDSWVRYEAQVKQRQQKELAEALIAKVQKEVQDPATLKQILQQSVLEVEKIVANKA